jgi:polar amino acid transport system substrate-binding protein
MRQRMNRRGVSWLSPENPHGRCPRLPSLVPSLAALLLSLLAPAAQAQQESDPARRVRVGINGDPPAVLRKSEGQVEGIALAYWQHIAEGLDWESDILHFDSVDESLSALANNRIDLAIGDITITDQRIKRFDFTEPIAQENLTLLLPPAPPTLWSTLRPFLGWAFVSSIGGIYLCLLVVGNLLWLAEHRHNRAFPREYWKGLSQGVWCALVTLTTVGYGDVVPRTKAGRIIAGFWMIFSVVIVTSLTAGIATTLALAFSDRPSATISSPQDLRGKRIATLGQGSAPTQWARFHGARVTIVDELEEAVALLRRTDVDGVMASRHGLEYFLSTHGNEPYKLANFNIATAHVGIALPRGSPLATPLNEVILQIQTQIRFQEIRDNWHRHLGGSRDEEPMSDSPAP